MSEKVWILANQLGPEYPPGRHQVTVATPAAEHRGEQPRHFVSASIPDHPALPAIARWLQEHNQSDLSEIVAKSLSWLCAYESYEEKLIASAEALIAVLGGSE